MRVISKAGIRFKHFRTWPFFARTNFLKSLYHLYSTLLRITPQQYGYIFAHPKLETVIGKSALKFIPFRRFPKQLSGEDYAETHVTRRSGVKVVQSLAETYCNQWDDGCTGARAWDGPSRSTIHTRHLQSETWQCECGRKLSARMWYVVKMRTSLGVMIVIRVQGHCGLLCCLLLSVWITALITFYGWTDGRGRRLPGFCFRTNPLKFKTMAPSLKFITTVDTWFKIKSYCKHSPPVKVEKFRFNVSQTVICQRPQEKP